MGNASACYSLGHVVTYPAIPQGVKLVFQQSTCCFKIIPVYSCNQWVDILEAPYHRYTYTLDLGCIHVYKYESITLSKYEAFS